MNRDLLTDEQQATEPLRPEASLGELLGEMTAETSQLFRKEIELAKVEAKDELRRVGSVSAMFAAAASGAWLTVLFASMALAWLLDRAVPRDAAFLIVAVIWLVVSLVLMVVARGRASRIRALPVTTQTLKEDVSWAKAQRN